MTSCSAVNLSADRDAGEKRAIPYLFACYQRAKEEVPVLFLFFYMTVIEKKTIF